MCNLDSKYNRKMCVSDIRLPLYTFSLLYPLRAYYIFGNYSLRCICFYDDLEILLVRVGQSTNFHSLSH